jgi:hypothetical protein
LEILATSRCLAVLLPGAARIDTLRPLNTALRLVCLMMMTGLVHVFAASSPGVPLIDDGTFVRIPIQVFGETNYFIIDSGSSASVIDLSKKDKLGKPLTLADAETPVGGRFDTTLYSAPVLRVGERVLQLTRVATADLSMARLISGEPCTGILGADAFSSSTVIFDFDRNSFSISTSQSSDRNESYIPLRELSGRLSVEATINGSENVVLLLDSSDTSAISLSQQDWKKVYKERANTVGKVALYSDVTGAVRKSQTARIRVLNIAGHEYTNLLCSLVPNPTSKSHLGLGFFRRHVLSIDFAKSRMSLKPRATFGRDDEDDLSGLHLLRKEGAVVVYAVDQESPAAQAGVTSGDEVTEIDGQATTTLSMRQIRQIFKSNATAPVKILVNREGVKRSFPLRISSATAN